MAKRREQAGGKKMQGVATEAGLKLVRLELTDDVHRQFRVEAAKEGVSMAAMARHLIEQWVEKRKAGGK